MDLKPENKLLKLKPDTVEYIRKQYNLDKPGQMDEAVDILHEWVQKQKHFKKKDFSRLYYELYIIANKGSLERAKKQIDTICTIRTALPRFFENINVKTDFGDFHDYLKAFMLPKLTDDHYRVDVLKLNDSFTTPEHFMSYYKYNIVYAEYVRMNDYANGYIILMDISESNLKGSLANLSFTDFKQAMTIYSDGYAMRMKAIHLICTSKLIEVFVAMLKQVVSPKVANRIYVHKSYEGLYEHIPKSILPKDYGGDERSMDELQKEWLDALSSEEHLEYMRMMNAAGTVENCRDKDGFNENYEGMPGTFRTLSVD